MMIISPTENPEANSPSKIVKRDFGMHFNYDLMFNSGDNVVEKETEMIENDMFLSGVRRLSLLELKL